MKLLIQPGDGITALLSGLRNAKKSIEIVIFRLDKREIETALQAAVARGVAVKALVAFTSGNGERNLRKLELRLLESGVTVNRTADDLARYHNKMLIIDRRTLYLLAFNYTTIDIDYSRSFGVITEDPEVVAEAVKLFEADTTRQPYSPGLDRFLVSPLNARPQLAAFLNGAQKQLLIYDNQLTDRAMIRILQNRAQAGVDIRIIGNIGKIAGNLAARKLAGMRLHTRAILRDGEQAFLGSQSLRKAELDTRREVGLIISEPKIVQELCSTFEADWAENETAQAISEGKATNLIIAAKAAKKAVKTLVNDLPALVPLVQEAAVGAVAETIETVPEQNGAEEVIKGAVKEAVREAVQEVIKESVSEVVQEIKVSE
jgi:cardiolipin synthase A/B